MTIKEALDRIAHTPAAVPADYLHGLEDRWAWRAATTLRILAELDKNGDAYDFDWTFDEAVEAAERAWPKQEPERAFKEGDEVVLRGTINRINGGMLLIIVGGWQVHVAAECASHAADVDQ